MSFSGQAILALHIAAAIFALGPGTAAIMSTPRYIRKGNAAVVGYLYRTTRIYAIGSVLVLVFGLILAQIQHEFSKWWISVSITLYVVAAVLLVLILRDQRKALAALQSAASSPAAAAPGTAVVPAAPPAQEPGSARAPADRSGEEGAKVAGDGEKAATPEPSTADPSTAEPSAPAPAPAPASAPAPAPAPGLAPVAAVERARISSLSGVVTLIWLVTLVLMVWK
jgi:Ca2+/Na+ antiporter